MFIVEVSGGLGNQMFQYAFGRALELKKKNIQTVYDTSWFFGEKMMKSVNSRNLEVNEIFNIQFKTISDKNIIKRIIQKKPAIKELVLPFLGLLGLYDIKFEKKPYDFDEQLLELRNKNNYFRGYFQSELYFKSFENILREEFTLKKDLSQYSRFLKKKIETTNSVSIHIRRGDYVKNETTNSIHGTCNTDYYCKSIDFIQSKIENCIFFIFSDDLPWVRKQKWIHELNHVIVETNQKRDYEDMILMSFCKHNIIANSTFSWWGAWLNQNEQKIVLSPKKWFANTNKNQRTKNLIPSEWHRI